MHILKLFYSKEIIYIYIYIYNLRHLTIIKCELIIYLFLKFILNNYSCENRNFISFKTYYIFQYLKTKTHY